MEEGYYPSSLEGLDDALPQDLQDATAGDLAKLGDRLLAVDDEIEELKKKRAEKELEWTHISRRMVELMEGKMTNFKGITARFQFDLKLYAGVKKEDQAKFLEWMKADENRRVLVKETVHPSTLKAFVKEMVKANQPIPEFIANRKFTEIKAVRIKNKEVQA